VALRLDDAAAPEDRDGHAGHDALPHVALDEPVDRVGRGLNGTDCRGEDERGD
jgi:hypothetical protein